MSFDNKLYFGIRCSYVICRSKFKKPIDYVHLKKRSYKFVRSTNKSKREFQTISREQIKEVFESCRVFVADAKYQ